MKVVIVTHRKTFEGDLPFDEINEIEIESFRWNPLHEFEYIRKGSPIWQKLKSNQDIMGLRV